MVSVFLLLVLALSDFPAVCTSLLRLSVCVFTMVFNPPTLHQSVSIYRVLGLSPALFMKSCTMSSKKQIKDKFHFFGPDESEIREDPGSYLKYVVLGDLLHLK